MDKYFDPTEAMIEFSEMLGFNFNSKEFQSIKKEIGEYSKQVYTFKYGNYDCVDFVKGLIEGC